MWRSVSGMVVVGLIVAVGLAACSGGAAGAQQTPEATPTASGPRLSATYEGALPIESQLILGTLQLEGTDLAVTQAQASELLLLWRAYQALGQSDTTAEAELNAVIDQIQETLTPEQVEAITALQLTQDDIRGVMEDLGIGPGAQGAANGDGSQTGGVLRTGGVVIGGGAGEFSGGVPGDFAGGPPAEFAEGAPGSAAAGGVFPQGQDLTADQLATLEASRGQAPNGGGQFSLRMLEPLLSLLEERAGS